MSESQDFHKFIIGEIRVDNWKSDWRKDFEAYMNNRRVVPKAVPVAIVRVSKPRVYQPRTSSRTKCPGCGGKMFAANSMGICTPCQRKWRKYIERPVMHFCSTCMVPIRSNTKHGLCELHAKRVRARLSAQKKAA